MPVSSLRVLANLISETITAIERSCDSRGVEVPDLDAQFSLQSDGPLLDPEIASLASTVIASASQLKAILRPAPISIFVASVQFHVPSALRIATETNVVEILREAGPQGLHIDDISARNGIDASILGRILRLLASEHIFREVSPDIFTNNRISSAIDTGKDVNNLLERPEDKYEGTSGVAAAICHFTDDQFKSSAYLLEALTDSTFATNCDSHHTAFNKAFNTDLNIFDWFERPGNEARLARFEIAFEGSTRLFPEKAIVEGYDWKALPKDSIIVDVGGGVGTQSMALAKASPHLKFIIQDRAKVMSDANTYLNKNAPELFSIGRIVLQEHNFFTPQPTKAARIYFLRWILHDWPEVACIQILKHLRAAAGPDTELIIVEYLMEYACEDTTVDENIHGMRARTAPYPLLQNYGHSNIFPYLCDMQMLASLNGAERTPAQFRILLEKSGWKLTAIHRARIGPHKLVATIA